MFSRCVSRKQLLNVLLGHLAAGGRGGFIRRRLVVYRSFRSVVLDYLGFIRIGIIIAAECRREQFLYVVLGHFASGRLRRLRRFDDFFGRSFDGFGRFGRVGRFRRLFTVAGHVHFV